jgi:tetratricopeptide (TPR) repeat protein
MSLFGKGFGKGRKPELKTGMPKIPAKKPAPKTRDELAADPNLIRCSDKYGQEIFITREQWRDNVLMGTIEKAWNNPDELYGIIVQSLRDEFVREIVPAAEQLHRIDPVPSRGATILGIAYMETGRLKDAEKVLSGHLARHGDDGVVLNNLAKVYSKRGQEDLSLKTLWHALEVDPNQDNGMGWYEVIHREKGGKEAGLEALRRVAAIRGSWRAQLWLARNKLENGQLGQALNLYKESLANAGKPAPTDLLMQMSGDLGNNGRLNEIIEWVEPCYDASIHGLQVGNNLIKANLELGHIDAARRIVDRLYTFKRPDWHDTLGYWDTELAKARLDKSPADGEKLDMTMVDIEGPLWMRNGSPFSGLLPGKDAGTPRIAIMGGTVIYSVADDKPRQQLADRPGRLSRALPLLLAEWLHLNTTAVAHGLIPWIRGKGFAVFGRPYADADLCAMADHQKEPVGFMVGMVLDTASTPWRIQIRLLRVNAVLPLGEIEFYVDPANPGLMVDRLLAGFCDLIIEHTDVRLLPRNAWYDVPAGAEGSDYLLRLEQQLAISCMNLDLLTDGLSGEREILDGTIQHCIRNRHNKTSRILLVQTLRLMKKARPDIMPEYKQKLADLQKEFPIPGEIGQLASKAIAEVFKG